MTMAAAKKYLKRLLVLSKKKSRLLATVAVIVWLLLLNFNSRYSLRTYEHINREEIFENLLVGKIGNLSESLMDCEYDAVLGDEGAMWPDADAEGLPLTGVRLGGEYSSNDCRPKFSSAIIIPYRDRAEQLHLFLMYMHTFLRRQHLHYRIYVVEQIDHLPFNRGMLLNIGAKAAMTAGFPCLILHDVDLLPLRPANIYACTEHPRHMSCSINRHRFVLHYATIFGGAVAMNSKQFAGINGMSNRYFGWGAEDDDLYYRLESHELSICRFDPLISQYHMVYHKPSGNEDTNRPLLESAKDRIDVDGLNSLRYSEVATVMHPLFTHIMVDLQYELEL